MLGELIQTAYTAGKDIYSAYKQMNDLKLSQEALLRSYYFEVCSNLDILKVIDEKKLKSMTVNSAPVFSMLACLETQIAAAVLFSADTAHTTLYDFLTASGTVDEIKEEDETTRKRTKTVLGAVQFTLQKITVLQKRTHNGVRHENSIAYRYMQLRYK